MKKYIVALDQGTTSSRAIIFDKEQNIIGMSQKEFTQIYLKEGWVNTILWRFGQLSIVYFKKFWQNLI